MACIICGDEASNQNDRYFVIPVPIVVPNRYSLCDTHKDVKLEFHDLYKEDGTRKTVQDYLFDQVNAHDFKNVRERKYEE